MLAGDRVGTTWVTVRPAVAKRSGEERESHKIGEVAVPGFPAHIQKPGRVLGRQPAQPAFRLALHPHAWNGVEHLPLLVGEPEQMAQ